MTSGFFAASANMKDKAAEVVSWPEANELKYELKYELKKLNFMLVNLYLYTAAEPSCVPNIFRFFWSP